MLRHCLAILLFFGVSGCASPPAIEQTPTTATPTQSARTSQWNLKLASQESVSITPGADTIEIHWGSQRAVAKVEADRVKILDGEKLLAKVKRKEKGFELEDETGARVLRVKFGKTLKVEDGRDHLVFEGRRQGETFVLQGAGQKPLGRLGQAGSVAYWDSPDGARLATLEGVIRWESALALACPGLTPPQRAALVIYMNRVME